MARSRSPSCSDDEDRERRRERKREKREKKERKRDRRRDSRSPSPRDRRDRERAEERPPAAPAPAPDDAPKRKRRFLFDVDADGRQVDAPPKPQAPAALPPTQALLVLQEQALLTKKVRCLHVGNVPGNVTAESLRVFINNAMHKEGFSATAGDTVIRIDPLPDKCAAFLEFRSPLECTNALGLSGIEFQSRQLRISRTRDYEPCAPALLNVVIPPGLPAPTTALQQAIAQRNVNVAAGYGNRPEMSGSTRKTEGLVFDGYAWTKSGQPRAHLSQGPREERPSTALELSRGARRVYVGNLPPTELLDNEALKSFFTRSMTERGLHDTSKIGPGVSPMIIGVHRDGSGKWAFVEFRTVAEATSCMSLTGIMMGNTALVVNRTKDYTPIADDLYPKLRAEGVIGNTAVCPDGQVVLAQPVEGVAAVPGVQQSLAPGGGPGIPGVPQKLMDASRRVRKIFIGNIPRDSDEVTPEYLLEYFTEAMQAANLTDPNRKGSMIIWAFIEPRNRSFGFVEFRTISEAESSFYLNGLAMLSRKLHVNRAREYEPISEAMKEDLEKHGLVGSTSVCTNGETVFPSDLPDPEEKTASSVVTVPLPQQGQPLQPLQPLHGPAAGDAHSSGGAGLSSASTTSYGSANGGSASTGPPPMQGQGMLAKPSAFAQDAGDMEEMLDQWVAAKRARDFGTADAIREQLRAKGIEPEKKRPGFDARQAPPKPPPAPEMDVEDQLDLWVQAKRAKDFPKADAIRSELRIRGVEPEAARPNWFNGDGGAAPRAPVLDVSDAPPPWVTMPPPPPLPSGPPPGHMGSSPAPPLPPGPPPGAPPLPARPPPGHMGGSSGRDVAAAAAPAMSKEEKAAAAAEAAKAFFNTLRGL